jgi:hypothetical protein
MHDTRLRLNVLIVSSAEMHKDELCLVSGMRLSVDHSLNDVSGRG